MAAGTYSLTLAESDASLSARTATVNVRVTATAGMVSWIEMRNNVPTLVLNNQAVAPTSLYVYNVEQTVGYDSANWLATFKDYVDKTKSTGVTCLAFEVYFHAAMFKTPTQPAVIGVDLDFGKMDALFDYAKQQGVYLLPTLWVSNPPEWWAAKHQDQLRLSYYKSAPSTDTKPTRLCSVGAQVSG